MQAPQNTSVLKQIDGMARPVSLMLNGSSTHATDVGGLLTILAYIAVAAWYFWQTALSF
jgi:hypothetical protein